MAMFRITSSKVVPYAGRAISSSKVVPYAVRAISSLSGSMTNAINGCDQNTGISHHHNSTDAKEQIDDKLVKIIKSEIKLKETFLIKPRCLVDSQQDDFPFKFQDNNWEKHIIMSRDFGGEKIDIFVDLHCCPPTFLEDEVDSTNLNISSSDDDSDNDSRLCVRLDVKISKENGNALETIAYAYADGEMRICNFSILNERSESNRRFCSYDVKEGSELEGALKEFLNIRGIRRSKYKYLYWHMIKKYKYCPVVILKELRNFIED